MAQIDLTKYGISGAVEILHNPSYEQLFAEETKPGLEGFEVGQVTELGAVNVMTGVYTGRSPKDKFIVKDYFICIILSLGVPPFFMLSGAFMLKKEISSISQFYLKSYGRLLPWCIFFFFVGSLFQILNTAYNKGTSIGDIDLPAFYADWFCRGGSGILWFIPALMGLYLITPLLVWIRKHTNLLVFSLLGTASKKSRNDGLRCANHQELW